MKHLVFALVACSVGLSLYACTTAPIVAPPTPVPVAASAPSKVDVEAMARVIARIDELLSIPLSQDRAAELALLGHPAAARALDAVGIATADRLQVAHTPNTDDRRVSRGSETRIERSLTVNVASWLSAKANGTVGIAAVDLLGTILFDARRAWVRAVAARQALQYHEDVAAAATVGRDLAERMRSIGNYAALDTLIAQRFQADALSQLTQARALASIERERLAESLGLWGASAERMQLPERLADLPAAAVGAEGIEARAVAGRLDIASARAGAGDDAEAAVRGRADVRTAWLSYRASYDLARHALDNVVPLAKQISAEKVKRYNGMLASVFDLIADAGEKVTVVAGALQAQREFWLSEVDLQQALAGMGRRSERSGAVAPSGMSMPNRPHH